MKRKCFSFDLVPVRDFIIEKDITIDFPSEEVLQSDFIFFDPPYWKQLKGDYSNHPTNLANLELDEFYQKVDEIMRQCCINMKVGSYFAFIHNNTTEFSQEKKQWHVFEFMKIAEKYFELVEWIDSPYSTRQYKAYHVTRAKKNLRLLNTSRYLMIWRKGE